VIVRPVLSYAQLHGAIDNPFPAQVPSRILSRNYLVYETLWIDSIANPALTFPSCLFAQSAIADALSSFLYFRAGVKVEVRMNSTPYHMGAIIVAWLPCTTITTPGLFNSTGMRPITLSASTQQACTFTIPYLSPKTFINLTSYDSGEIATVYFRTLFPLITTSPDVSEDVHVQIYASFTDIEVAGYIPSVPSRLKRGEKIRVQAQSKDIRMADGSIRTTGTRADSDQHEAEYKTKNNTTSGGLLGKYVRPFLRSIPIIGGVIDPILDVFKLIFSAMDKPTTVAIQQPVSIEMTRDWVQADGIDNSQVLSLYQAPAVASLPQLMGGESSSMSLNQFTSIPMLHKVYILDTAQTQFSIYCTPYSVDNTEGQPDFLWMASRTHQFWRGSIKYMFQFFTTAFTSCRVRISLNYVNWTSAVTTTGDVISKIVDIKGDTTLTLTVPYLWETHWRQFDGLNPGPVLVTELITPIIGQSQVSDSTIYVAVWRSGGPDMQFQLLTSAPPPSSKTRIFAQCDVRSEFKKSFDPIIDGASCSFEKGFVSVEMTGCMNDMFKRYAMDMSEDNTLPLPGAFYTGAFSVPFHFYAQCFMFWRGSRRKKFITSNGAPDAQYLVVPDIDSYANGSSGRVGTIPNIYPMLGVEIPWYNNLPYTFTDPSTAGIPFITPIGIATVGSTIPQQWFIAAGDDYNLGFIVPPHNLLSMSKEAKPREKPYLKKRLIRSHPCTDELKCTTKPSVVDKDA